MQASKEIVADPAYVARAFINLGDWGKVYGALHPEASEAKARVGGQKLSQRRDVSRALDTIRRRQAHVRKTKDDLLLYLEQVIDTAEKDSDRIAAVRTYAELAGYRREDKKQAITVINMTQEEVRIAEHEIKSLPAPVEDPLPREPVRPL